MLSQQLNNKLYAYFKKRLGMYDYTKGWLKGLCPSCGGEKYGVHLGMYRSNCFKCGYHERPLYVVCFVENLDYIGALHYIKAFEGVEYKEPQLKELIEKPLILPEGFRLLSQGNSQIAQAMRNYIEVKRGLDPYRLAQKGWGYCVGDRLFGYIVIPYYLKGRLIYYTTRRVMGTGPKFDNPNIEDIGLGKSVLVYNYDALYYYDHIYIVESAMNAETLGDNACAFGGKKLSKHQVTSIIQSPCERLTILLDPDAYHEALLLALKLVQYKKVQVVLLPEDEDVNSYGHGPTFKKIWKTPYMQYNEILKLKKDYERSLAAPY